MTTAYPRVNKTDKELQRLQIRLRRESKLKKIFDERNRPERAVKVKIFNKFPYPARFLKCPI